MLSALALCVAVATAGAGAGAWQAQVTRHAAARLPHAVARLDFGPIDDEVLRTVARRMQTLEAALNAAVDEEDYAEAQRLKREIEDFTEVALEYKEQLWAEAATAAFTTDATDANVPMAPSSGFRYDTRSTRGVFSSSNAFEGAVACDAEWTEELAALVCAQMINAFDNYPPQEVAALLDALVEASSQQVTEAEVTLRRLAALSREMEALEEAARRGEGAPEFLQDEASALRSQIRMYGKDGET